MQESIERTSAPIKLRGYQEQAIRSLVNDFRRKKQRVMVMAPCGAGKTTIFAAIARAVTLKGKKVIFVVHRKELVEQAYDRAKAFGLDAGIIMADDKRYNDKAPVQIASTQTLVRRSFHDADFVFIDEAHRSCGRTKEMIEKYSAKGSFVIGLSATPMRTDKKGLGDIYESIVVAAQYSELIADGHLVKPRIFAPNPPDLSQVRKVAGDYDEGQLSRLMSSVEIVGNIVDHWKKHAEGRQTVLFAVNCNHSDTMSAAFRSAGIRAKSISWSTPRDKRNEAIEQLKKHEIDVLCNVAILTEGWDMPDLDCAIIARPTASHIMHIQTCGRVLRPSSSGRIPIILDHAGNTRQHGPIWADRWYELTESQETKNHTPPEQKVCPGCGCVCEPAQSICPECGHIFREQTDVHVRDEELTEVDPESSLCGKCGALLKSSVQGKFREWVYCPRCRVGEAVMLDVTQATTEDKTDELRRLLTIAKQKGFQKGWSSHKYRELFGVWPHASIKQLAGY